MRKSRTKEPAEITETLPVARIAVDVSLPHLDRPFDYLVPEDLAAAAQPGARVKVRFAGKDLDGFVLERLAESDHDGKLMRLRKVVSPERVLTPEVADLCRAVLSQDLMKVSGLLGKGIDGSGNPLDADALPRPAVVRVKEHP